MKQQYQHADHAQQAFSSEKASTLHLAIPALEALHRAWLSRAERPRFERFFPALEAAYKKIDEYYEKTTSSPAYILAMSMLSPFINDISNALLVLNPKEKMSYFKKHWSTELQSDVKNCVEEVVSEIYSRGYFACSVNIRSRNGICD